MHRLLKSFILLLVVLATSVAGLWTPCRSQGFYDMDTINSIQIIFSQTNWDWILDSMEAAGNNARLAGTAIINSVQYDSVGVRYKGHSSYSPSRIKKPLNIKLDYVYEDQLLEGYGTIVLSNGWSDPSFVRETLSYEIARKYMPASLANYAVVTINGQLIGLYDNVQDLDKYFLRTHYSSDDNPFFKGESQGFPSTSVVWGYQGADSMAYTNHFDMQSDYGWADLVNFLYVYNYQSANIPNVLDVDNHLWMLAYDILMVNLDGPINWANNYYIYKDGSGQINPILWDLNMNMGGFTQLIGQGGPNQNLSFTQMQQLNPYLNATNSNFPIVKNVLSDTTNKRMYIAHMKTIMAENFSNNWYYTRAQQIQSIISASYQADPNKFYTYTQFQANLNTAQGGGPGGGTIGLTQLMAARISYLNNLAPFTAAPPAIANVSYSPITIPPNSTIWFRATAIGATKVLLGYRHGDVGRFYRTLMYDDGNHNDQLAGDGIFGASILAGLADINYYIWAEDSDAGIFSPIKAEKEFHYAPVQRQLVINELMADNEATVPDPQGEYEDWIELYNGSSSAMSLAGIYLTDDAVNPGKWDFPDTSIAPFAYLIVWADGDTADVGLHASFSLNRDGEAVGLYQHSGGNFLEIDFINFDLQAADISYGRFPNGTGNFIAMPPTFSLENRLDTVSPVVINEINYNSDSTFNAMDWVELVNNSASTINLSGWIFKDSDDLHSFVIPTGTSLQANQYLVLCEDTSAFRSCFLSVSNYVGPFGFGLSNGGELLRLYDAMNQIVDSLTYDDQLPWPVEPDGEGPTLELLDPDLPNFNPANWRTSILSHGSPGIMNQGTSSPIIITMAPLNPPIQIPASGGSFQYNVNIHNTGTTPVNMDVWIMMKLLPSGNWTGPYLNANRTLPGSANPVRLRTQNIAGSLLSGNYLYEGRVGVYPDTIWSSSNFSFTKQSAGAGAWVGDFDNYGEDLFDEFIPGASPKLPVEFALHQNYPNPYNPITTIRYELPTDSKVRMEVYDVSGRLVQTLIDGWREAGFHEATFDGSGLSSGLYFLKVHAGNFHTMKKMVMVK